MGRHSAPRQRRGRRAGVLLAATVLTVPAGALMATPAQAAETADEDRTAVVGPLLDFFGFGATVGAPVFCGVLSASIGSGFQEFGASEQGNTLVDGINSGCDVFAQQGNDFVEQGKVAQAPFAESFNSFANPAIGGIADAVSAFGTDFGPALAPFGPTVAGSGKTINFFQGSPPAES